MDKQLMQAYQATNYVIDTQPPVTVRIGQSARALLKRATAIRSLSIITGYNPRSHRVSDAVNAAANQRLRTAIHAVPGADIMATTVAQDPNQQWPDEIGFLVANLSMEALSVLARGFDQHAVVWMPAPEFIAEVVVVDSFIA